MQRSNAIRIFAAFCLIELVAARTINLYANNDNKWLLAPFATSIVEPQKEPQELIKEKGQANAFDPIAINELLKTKQPVIRSSIDDKGRTRTITYKLEPDGSISRRTLQESQPLLMNENVGDVENVPIEEILKLDQPVSKTYRDEDGNIVRKTYSVPESTFKENTLDQKPALTKPNDWPNFDDILERRHKPKEDEEEIKTVKLPESWKPETWPKEERRPTYDDAEWLLKKPTFSFDKTDFDDVDTRTPGTVTKTFVDDNGRTVKTTLTVGPTTWTRKTYKFPISRWQPDLPDRPNTTNTGTTTTTQFPSLDDFLKSQYDKPTTNNEKEFKTTTTTTKPTQTTTTTSYTTTTKTVPPTTQTADKSVTKINVDDLPLMEVLNPADLRPVVGPQIPIKTFSVNNIPKSDSDTEFITDPTKNVQTKTFSKTLHTSGVPTLNDLEPKMREILINAGVTDEDLKTSNGETVVKTRVLPNGNMVKTTFRLLTVPTIKVKDEPKVSLTPRNSDFPSLKYPNYGQFFPDYEWQSFKPLPKWGLIDTFLAKIDLSTADILAKNGELVKTIMEDNGRILTATFVLSDVKGDVSKKSLKSEDTLEPFK